MNLINNILGSLFGKKSDKDIQAVLPILDQIKEQYEQIKPLSNDDLRAKSKEIKDRVKAYVEPELKQIEELKEKAESPETEIEEKEIIYEQVDKVDENIDQKYKEILDEVLPEVFALVKETARRFKEHEELVELVRQALSRQICQQHSDVEKRIRVITVSKDVDEEIKNSIVVTEKGKRFAMEPGKQKQLLTSIADEVKKVKQNGIKPVFLTSPEIRSVFSTIVSTIVPSAAVVSSMEISPDIKLEAVGNIAIYEEVRQ